MGGGNLVDRHLLTDILKMDTGLESTDFKSVMGDIKAWGTIVIRGHYST